MSAVADRPLEERVQELAALERLLEAARAGVGGGLLVEGPPGIGKSRLLAAARAAAGPSIRVVSARGSELERDFPFAVVRQLLEPVLVAADSEERRALLDGAGALAAPVLVPTWDGNEPLARDAAASVLHGLYWLTANLASRAPLLLLVDDLHWADLPSLRWLAYLSQRLDGMSLGILAATRPDDGAVGQTEFDTLAAHPSMEMVQPVGLSEAAVGRLAERRLSTAADPEFVAVCHRVTGGNPFLLHELLGELASGDVAPSSVNAGLVARQTSRSVNRAASARLRRLAPQSRALAHAVVVLGDGTELSLAAQLAELDADAANDAADALVEASILAAERPLSFVHPLVRASVYAELGAGARDRAHRHAAAMLAAAGAAADRVAVHLLACDPRRDAGTVDILRRAARTAQRRGANDAAVVYLQRARREPPAPELGPQVALELGAAEAQADELDPACEHLGEAVRGLEEPRARALAAAQLATALSLTGRDGEAVAALSEAIDELPGHERELGLLLQAGRAAASVGDAATWRRSRIARFEAPAGPPRSAGERLRAAELAFRAALEEPAAKGRTLALQALAGGRLLEDPGPSQHSFYLAPLALIFTGALEEATAVLDAVLEWADRRGSVFAFAQAVNLRAWAWSKRGALDEAEADAESALVQLHLRARPALVALIDVRLARGDVAGAAALWHDTQMDEQITSNRTAIAHRHARGQLRAALGRPHEALEDLLACGRLEQEWGIRTPAMSHWRSGAALVLAELGRVDEARRLAHESVARCRWFGSPCQLGTALRIAGRCADRQPGLEFLAESVHVLEGSPARLEHARAAFELGAALRRAGRRADARAPLRDAIELARRCGAEPLAVRAHDELVAAGAKPRRDPIESRSRLTASELRVARLAADGMTNREIAQSLFLTEKTIEVHLTSSYRKLDIGSRTQLGRALPAAL